MSRIYSAQFTNTNVNVSQDFFQLTNSSSTLLVLHEVRLGQDSLGTAAQYRVGIYRASGSATGCSGNTTFTPVPKEVGDSASQTQICKTTSNAAALTTGAGATSTTLWLVDDWNSLSGWYYLPAPEDRIVVPPTQSLFIRGITAGSTVNNGTVVWEEIG
jgi:hypothetical protein